MGRILGLAAVVAFTIASGLSAQSAPAPVPTLDPHPQGLEVAFVSGIQSDLNSRFPSAADAMKAGYFRSGNEDKTGAISYVNLQWKSIDPQHPSQLWYDAKGRLLGADFSVLRNSPTPPSIWGVDPRRWIKFPAHVHYILTGATGDSYGYIMADKFAAAGGDLTNPKPETVVALGKAANAEQIVRIYLFPAIWDLIVWVKANPDGAFANKNPDVTPSSVGHAM
ncbi:MAG: hypothetical protein JO263_10800 [Candidatus Eremiobacteraeota bacterium]|nr:hypothetical protein [Candidatus Eremiobacteraeota bacterium]